MGIEPEVVGVGCTHGEAVVGDQTFPGASGGTDQQRMDENGVGVVVCLGFSFASAHVGAFGHEFIPGVGFLTSGIGIHDKTAGSQITWQQYVVEVAAVLDPETVELFHVVETAGGSAPFPCGLRSGQQYRCQNRNNGNDDQKFDQSEILQLYSASAD